MATIRPQRTLSFVLALSLSGVALADTTPAPSLQALAQKRADAARSAYTAVEADWRSGRVPLDTVYQWSVRWYASQRAAGGSGSAAATEHLKRMQGIEQVVNVRYQMGTSPASEKAQAAFYRAEAELFAAEAAGANPVGTKKQ